MNKLKYPFSIRILTDDDGGGYLIEFPDLPGCISDGDTIDEAIANGRDAISCWIETAKQYGDEIPTPKPSIFTHEVLEKGIIREENPSDIDPNKVIHQHEPFATPSQTWEFDWSLTASATV